jgi:hypothetical protein
VRRGLVALVWAGCAAPEPSPDDTAGPAPTLDLRAAQATVGVPFSPDLAGAIEGSTSGWAWTWDFGDGLTATGEQPGVTFDTPGHRTAFVTVTDTYGRTASDAFPLSVVLPLPDRDERDQHGPMVFGAQHAFVAMPDHDRVAIAPLDGGPVRWWSPECPAPFALAHAPRGQGPDVLFVGCAGRGSMPGGWLAVEGLETETPVVRRRVTLDDAVLQSLIVEAVDAASETVLAVLLVRPDDPARPEGQTRLARWRDGASLYRLWAWDGHRLGAMTRAPSRVYAIDAAAPADTPLAAWAMRPDDPWDPEPTPIALPDDPGPDSDTSSRGRPTFLDAVAVSPNAAMLAVGGTRANIGRGVIRDGLPLTDETTVRGTLRRIDLVTGAQTASARVDNRDRYAAVAWSEAGDWLYAGVAGSGEVDVIDPWRWERVGAAFDGGAGLRGLFVVDGTLWGYAAWDRALVRWSLHDPSAPSPMSPIDLQPPEGEPLAPPVLAGAKLFEAAADPRMSLDGYIACASCHRDGVPDGHSWDFTQRGEGVRNTPDLRGLGRRPGPLHWSGNFDEVQDFEADIRNHQGGLGYLDDVVWASQAGPSLGAPKAGQSEALDALAAYLAWLPPAPTPWARDASEASTFLASGCGTCHPGGGTDSQWLADGDPLLHDVGTLTAESGQRLGGALWGIDTPDLRGSWATGPWLHDGSAPTLGDAIQRHAPVDEAVLPALVDEVLGL